MKVTKKQVHRGTLHEINKANYDENLMMPSSIQWEFKKLPPSEVLDDMIRCILLCHECVRLEEVYIEKHQFKEEEYEAFAPIKDQKEIQKTIKEKERHVSEVLKSKYNLQGSS